MDNNNESSNLEGILNVLAGGESVKVDIGLVTADIVYIALGIMLALVLSNIVTKALGY
tara:strand:- start:170 stop:343 length:174 start_codon:yes stop_codon:yes gene_type:complete